MKTATLLTALISSLAMFAVAQAFGEEEVTETPQYEETEIPAATTAPPRVEPQAKVRPVARTRRSSRANRDARHCLDLHSNHDIIKCAEKYL